MHTPALNSIGRRKGAALSLEGIAAFAASGISSDHEAWTAEEAFAKLQAGLFLEIRIHTGPEIVAGLLDRGLRDWSQVALATDDRPAQDVLRDGATDRNVRMAIDAGLPRSWPLVLDALRSRGLSADDIASVYLTQGHFDHVGLAELLQEDHHVPIHVNAADDPLARHQ